MLYDNLTINDRGHLTIAGHDTTELVREYGTPLMVLDEDRVRDRCRTYVEALREHFPAGSLPLYASKALSFKEIYRLAAMEGMGIDVVSIGEIHTAHQAGFPLERAYFHGNNKTDEDIAFAMERGVGYFVCDNLDELDAIDAKAGRHGIRQKLLLRLTPGIDPHTHEKINTGRIDSKFGAAIETGQAEELVVRALSKQNVELMGYHCHIGSQIFDHTPFCDAAILMLQFVADMRDRHGFCAPVLNLGGGMGVPYTDTDPVIDYKANIEKIGKLVADTCKKLNIPAPAILMEPGRSLVADACTTLYTVGGTKVIPGFKNYVSVDGGMTDNPRYALYQAAYTVALANRMQDPADFCCTVAGRCCESGDLIQEDVAIPTPHRGDLLAVFTTGAYNYSMASNYNRVPRPAMVALSDGQHRLVIRRESLDDLTRNDV